MLIAPVAFRAQGDQLIDEHGGNIGVARTLGYQPRPNTLETV